MNNSKMLSKREYNAEQQALYRLRHPGKRQEYERAWRLRNQDKMRDYRQRWRTIHPEVARDVMRRNRLKRIASDPAFKVRVRVSTAICNALKVSGSVKGCGWEKLVGYTITDLRTHLESKFELWMSWENYGKGGWEIDHIQPTSKFDLPAQIRECWALSNLQPLACGDNVRKGNK